MRNASRSRSKNGIVPALVELCRAWWSVDRIRISPAAGQLLRLDDGTLLEIDGVWYEVASRHLLTGPAGVTYDCAGRQHQAKLEITLVWPGQQPTMMWICEGIRRPLDPTEIEIYPRE